ncbi:hypothetical protein DL93DRAFT_2171610 [Clavulina sp. PMI_390]|nr:hypothetical protein DL93DRAFT_2171610 [Clavulina sp. PMI_390]
MIGHQPPLTALQNHLNFFLTDGLDVTSQHHGASLSLFDEEDPQSSVPIPSALIADPTSSAISGTRSDSALIPSLMKLADVNNGEDEPFDYERLKLQYGTTDLDGERDPIAASVPQASLCPPTAPDVELQEIEISAPQSGVPSGNGSVDSSVSPSDDDFVGLCNHFETPERSPSPPSGSTQPSSEEAMLAANFAATQSLASTSSFFEEATPVLLPHIFPPGKFVSCNTSTIDFNTEVPWLLHISLSSIPSHVYGGCKIVKSWDKEEPVFVSHIWAEEVPNANLIRPATIGTERPWRWVPQGAVSAAYTMLRTEYEDEDRDKERNWRNSVLRNTGEYPPPSPKRRVSLMDSFTMSDLDCQGEDLDVTPLCHPWLTEGKFENMATQGELDQSLEERTQAQLSVEDGADTETSMTTQAPPNDTWGDDDDDDDIGSALDVSSWFAQKDASRVQ